MQQPHERQKQMRQKGEKSPQQEHQEQKKMPKEAKKLPHYPSQYPSQ